MRGMGVLLWIGKTWFDLVQSLGIIAGLLFTSATFRRDARERRVANLIEITKQHREIWAELFRQPGLARVLDIEVDLVQAPVTREEEVFIRLLILHLNSVYEAMKNGVFMKPDGLRKDIRRFFTRPVARTVWERMRPLQDIQFVRFVEACLTVA
jgi:hypothetical protein